jgi:hypothetical protein
VYPGGVDPNEDRLKTKENTRRQALETIKQNIERHGHHIYVVWGAPCPRYAYTIGTGQRLGAELILAGASFYIKDEVVEIINSLAAQLAPLSTWSDTHLTIGQHGSFSLRRADRTWVNELMIGASDYYSMNEIQAFQVVPDESHWTVDVPNMSDPWSATSEPVWQWMKNPWQFSVPSNATAMTNLRALHGERITEVVRWEEDYWEAYAGSGPDIPDEEQRPVPLGTLLGADESLRAIVELRVEQGLWREADAVWHTWGKVGDG